MAANSNLALIFGHLYNVFIDRPFQFCLYFVISLVQGCLNSLYSLYILLFCVRLSMCDKKSFCVSLLSYTYENVVQICTAMLVDLQLFNLTIPLFYSILLTQNFRIVIEHWSNITILNIN